MQDTIGELEKLDRLDKCSMATKTKTWTTQREDIRFDPYPRATTGERWIAQFSSLSVNSFFEEFIRQHFT